MKKFLINTEINEIKLSNIDIENGFVMSRFFDIAPLEKSISENGLLNPVAVDNRKRLLSGYRRFTVYKVLGEKTIPCVVAQGEEKNLFRAILLENLSHRKFNHLESALVINRLTSWYDKKTIVSEYLPLLGYSSSPKMMEALSEVLSFEQDVQQALAQEELLLSDIRLLQRIDSLDRGRLVKILLSINAGLNARKEILENLFEISKRDDKSIAEVLEKLGADSIVSNEKLSLPERTAAFRKAVRLERYPLLVSLEQEFFENVKKLKLPQGASIQWPPFFEGSDYRLTIPFKDEKDLAEKFTKLKDLGNAKILPKSHID